MLTVFKVLAFSFVSKKHYHGIPSHSLSKKAYWDNLNENPMLGGNGEIEFRETEYKTGLSGKRIIAKSSENEILMASINGKAFKVFGWCQAHHKCKMQATISLAAEKKYAKFWCRPGLSWL